MSFGCVYVVVRVPVPWSRTAGAEALNHSDVPKCKTKVGPYLDYGVSLNMRPAE